MKLQVYDYVDVGSIAHLPGRDAVFSMVRAAATRPGQLRAAPLVEPYAGPAILRGRAAGVFFHEIFGHRVEGHRQKDEDEGQTFTSRVNQPILPSFLSVVDDPTLARIGEMRGLKYGVTTNPIFMPGNVEPLAWCPCVAEAA